MKTLLSIAGFLASIIAAAAVTVTIPLKDCRVQSPAGRDCIITPMTLWPTNGVVPIYDPQAATSDAGGIVTVDEMMPGTYQLDVLAPPHNTTIYFRVDTTSQFQNVATNLIAQTNQVFPGNGYAWSAQASDLRYAKAGEAGGANIGAGTNITLTTNNGIVIINAAAVTNGVNGRDGKDGLNGAAGRYGTNGLTWLHPSDLTNGALTINLQSGYSLPMSGIVGGDLILTNLPDGLITNGGYPMAIYGGVFTNRQVGQPESMKITAGTLAYQSLGEGDPTYWGNGLDLELSGGIGVGGGSKGKVILRGEIQDDYGTILASTNQLAKGGDGSALTGVIHDTSTLQATNINLTALASVTGITTNIIGTNGVTYWVTNGLVCGISSSAPPPPPADTVTISGAGYEAANGSYVQDDSIAVANGYVYGWFSVAGDYFGSGGTKIGILLGTSVCWVGSLDAGFYRSDTPNTDPVAINDWYSWADTPTPVPTITRP